MRNYEELEVWQKAHALTIKSYRITERFPRSELFGLTSQIRRAAGSIGANLAEGCGRWGDKDLGFLIPSEFAVTIKDLTSVRQMLTAFLQTLRDVRTARKSAPFLANSERRRANGDLRLASL